MNRRGALNSPKASSTYPFLAYGEITSMGTRNPRSQGSILGGSTWSYRPPHSSQEMKRATESHMGLSMIPLTMSVTQFMACLVLNGGWSDSWNRGVIQVTEG